MWESVILLLGYVLYIAFMTKNEKVLTLIPTPNLFLTLTPNPNPNPNH